MSDALILAETLDALATLSEDTNGRELRTLRDAARTIREQHAALAKREAVADEVRRNAERYLICRHVALAPYSDPLVMCMAEVEGVSTPEEFDAQVDAMLAASQQAKEGGK